MPNESFTILIVEDEGLVAKDLEARLMQTGYSIAGIADNYRDAINLFKVKSPDLVLLDITLKGKKNGVDIAAEIIKILPTPFIFVTAHTDADTLGKAKNTFPASYLVKPFTTSNLLVSVELALHNFAYQKTGITTIPNDLTNAQEELYLKQDFIFVKDNNIFIKLHQADVEYIEAQDNYVKLVTKEKNYLVRCSLAGIIDKMKKDYFIRIHRSFCININKVENFTEFEVSINNNKIPIGRNYKEEFINRLHLR